MAGSQEARAIGHALRTARVNAGRSQQWVADKLGVSRQTVLAWEQGQQTPSEVNRARIGQLLGLGADEVDSLTHGNFAVERAEPSASINRTLPQAAREWVADFLAKITKGGATDLEVDEARTVLTSPQLTAYLAGGALRAAQLTDEEVIGALKAVGEHAILRVLRKRGRNV